MNENEDKSDKKRRAVAGWPQALVEITFIVGIVAIVFICAGAWERM